MDYDLDWQIKSMLNSRIFRLYDGLSSLNIAFENKDLNTFSIIVSNINFKNAIEKEPYELFKLLLKIEEKIISNPLDQDITLMRDMVLQNINLTPVIENTVRFILACETGNIERLNGPLMRVNKLIVDKSNQIEVIRYLISQGYDFKDKIFLTSDKEINIFLYKYYIDSYSEDEIEDIFKNAIFDQNLELITLIMKQLNFDVKYVYEPHKRNLYRFETDDEIDEIESFRIIDEFLLKYPTHEIKVRNLPLDESIQDLENTISNLFKTSESLPQSISQMVADTVIENLRFQIQELESLRI